MTIKKEFIKTSDLNLTGCLAYFGHTLERIDKNGGAKATFVISKNKDTGTIIQDYWQQKLLVEPMVYANTIKSIKAQLYS